MPETSVVLTGAAGFIGRNLAEVLAEEVPEVRVVCVDRGRVEGAAESRAVDLAEGDAVSALLTQVRPTAVFHLAGVPASAGWEALYAANVLTTIRLLEAVEAEATGCRVVVPGSAAEYGRVPADRLPVTEDEVLRPVTPYGVAKAWQTRVALSFVSRGVDVVVGRMFNLLGPGTPASLLAGAMAEQLRAILAGSEPRQLRVGNLSARRDLLDVADAGRGLVALWRSGRSGDVYNICSGVSTPVAEVVTRMVELSGTRARIVVEPGRFREGDVDESVGCPDRIAEATGWRPRVSLDDALRRTLGPAFLR